MPDLAKKTNSFSPSAPNARGGSGGEDGLKIHADIAPKLNFAAHQCAFPVLYSLEVENLHTAERFEDLILTLRSDPAFIKEKVWPVDRILPGNLIRIEDRDLEVSGGYLMERHEAVQGAVTLRLEKDGDVLAELREPVELLAYNEWGGAGFMPELLAAFCMPNDPAVDSVLRNAGERLRKAGRLDQIDGYKSRSRERVWEIASAIYSAISDLDLSYAIPPASFEHDGQKVRVPSRILDKRVATCLDAAMLFAAAFEQAGLNPIVALPKGHALVGVWLQPKSLSTIAIDEAETLRKRIDLSELLLIETTCVTSRPAPSFSKALDEARRTVRADDDSTFIAAVDIRRARAHRIKPLALKSNGVPGVESPVVTVELPLEEAPPLPAFDDTYGDEERPGTPESRLERWQRKLLDLTLRNPLLNHRSTQTSLSIICPNPARLRDRLATGNRLRIVSVPQPSSQTQDEEIHVQRTGELISEEYARDELDHGRILVDLSPQELPGRAVKILRRAQTALQEGGANTLYLAIGFLRWKRKRNDDRKFRAPLILLPVTLQRKSVRSGITMVAHDDEPRFNTTLLEMLRRDFGIEIPGLAGDLPADNTRIDVAVIWNCVRQAVKEAPGFEVVKDVVLGHFSFAKHLMWKDLGDRTEALREHDVVRHLMDTPNAPYGSDFDFVEPSRLDRDYKPSDLLTALSADSSQMATIAAADNRKNFVVIGPPGTGKSQTISNLIGHLLGKGKTVLFVSEKTAALEVVYRRLDKIGLGRFCLELHSNKARKTDVLKQLEAAWEATGVEPEEWRQKADELLILRNRLNRFVDHLHRKCSNGLTAYYAMGVKVRDEELARRVSLIWPSSDYHSDTDLTKLREVVQNLSIQAKEVGDISQSPFHWIETGNWSPRWQEQVVERCRTLSSKARTVGDLRGTLCRSVELELPNCSMTRLESLDELASVLLDSFRQPTSYALEPDGLDRIEALKEAEVRLEAYQKYQGALSCPYEPFAWRLLDGKELSRRWTEANREWWPMSVVKKRRIAKEMCASGAQGNPDPSSDAATLAALRSEGEAINRLDRRLSGLKGWAGHTTTPAAVVSLRKLGERARKAVGKLADDPQELEELRGKVRVLLHDGNDLLAPDGSVGRTATDYLCALNELRHAISKFEEIAGVAERERFAAADDAPTQIRETADEIIASHLELRGWCKWRERRATAVRLGLVPLVAAVEEKRVPPDEIEQTFEAAYCTWWSTAIMEEDKVLRTFSTPEHEAAIAKFRGLDDEYRQLTARYIAATLSGRLQDRDQVGGNWQWGVLQREIRKRMRHKPVRKLLEAAPDVLTKLTPCFMMSPLSVAQYLPVDQALFDVVIFDEASQITVWDAVGSMARGRQVIVAGDPKQMPPSNFFARADDDPDGDIETEGDLESILEEMIAASIPVRTLNLHYRSRHESLIAFSNDRYYQNELITFPAPKADDVAVRLKQLSNSNAFYARGGARTNQGEARAIVEEIVSRLTHPDPNIVNRSIGVVTFNSEQQTLIEDLLDKARTHHEIEHAFSTEAAEPVFVKNLETVQGDERDVILFSVTYGPDRAGHVTMNFGPLNRDGGERRLNVALTRARHEMIVFSTLRPDAIDRSRTRARAVADLRDFLRYAENGRGVLGGTGRGYGPDFDSPFEMAVSHTLESKGWTVHPQVGVSAYRIDLGVLHPDAPGRYLAGVECDGATYHSSRFARERDKIRQAVLEDLGWRILRIWSTDWWTNSAGAIIKLDGALRKRLKHTRLEQDEQHPRDTSSDNVVAGLDSADESQTPTDPEDLDEPEHETHVASGSSPGHDKESQEGRQTNKNGLLPYPEFNGPLGLDPRTAHTSQVAEGLCRIIQVEGPMLAKRAYDIYLRGCGVRRMGRDLKRRMNKALQYAVRRSLVVSEDEWSVGGLVRSIVRSPDSQPVVARERGPREFHQIPPSELQLVARQLRIGYEDVLEFGSDEHLRTVLKAFGGRRLTTRIRTTLVDVLECPYSYVDLALREE